MCQVCQVCEGLIRVKNQVSRVCEGLVRVKNQVCQISEGLDRVKIQVGQECLFVWPRGPWNRLVLAMIRTRHYA